MLAYQHGFHAGNHADVLKHMVLLQLLRHLQRKPTGVRLVDTHAGAGLYDLRSAQALKTRESEHGIARLWSRSDTPPAVADYLAQVRLLNDGAAGPMRYPGSPWFMHTLLRPQDQLRLFELHPAEHRALTALLGAQRGVQIRLADGFAGLKSQLPPPTRRALVLIDPSYEGHADYKRVLDAVRDGLHRFAEGMVMVWHPLVGKPGAADMVQRLKAVAPRGWLHAQLMLQPTDAQGFGLAGSGVLVLNPPYTLHAELQSVLPWLVQALARTPAAAHRLEQHAL